MKKTKYGTPRKLKALRRSIVCFLLLALFLLLHFHDYNSSLEQALDEAYRRYGTGKLAVVNNYGQPVEDERFPEFYLCANENALLHMGISHDAWNGWEPIAVAALDCSEDAAVHSMLHYLHTFYNAGNLKVSFVVFGRVDDDTVQRVEVVLHLYDGDEDITMETDEFIEFEGHRYFMLLYNANHPYSVDYTLTAYDRDDAIIYSRRILDSDSSQVK